MKRNLLLSEVRWYYLFAASEYSRAQRSALNKCDLMFVLKMFMSSSTSLALADYGLVFDRLIGDSRPRPITTPWCFFKSLQFPSSISISMSKLGRTRVGRIRLF